MGNTKTHIRNATNGNYATSICNPEKWRKLGTGKFKTANPLVYAHDKVDYKSITCKACLRIVN